MMKAILHKIPFLDEYFHYFRVFKRTAGSSFFGLLGVWVFMAVLDGVGISLLLPLLKAGNLGGELEGKTRYLEDFLAYVGIPLEIHSILLFLGGVFLIKGGFKFFQVAFQERLAAQIMKKMKGKLLLLYEAADHQYFSSRNTGHFINIINGQVNKFITGFNVFAKFSGQFLTALVYIIFAFTMNALFSTLAVFIGAFVLLFLRSVARFARQTSVKMSQENSRLQKFIVQTLHAMKFLKATARFGPSKREVNESIRRLARFRVLKGYANGLTKSVREPITFFSLIGIILVQVLYFEEPIAPIFVTLLLFYRAMNAIVSFQETWQLVMNTAGGVQLVLDEEAALYQNQEVNKGTKLEGFRESLSFDSVDFAYKQGGEKVIKSLDLHLKKNETIALVGRSGAGKSTLTDMITLLLKPTGGDIRVDGVSYRDFDPVSWRKRIGLVPQDTVVFDDTVANNICLWECDPEKPECMDRIRDAAKRAHCLSFIEEMEQGFDTIVGDRGVRLSGGQRQRLAIARELFRQPELLILDEATSSLDTDSEKHIQSSIDELMGRTTLVIIAHRLSTIKNVDRIYVLDHGRIVEQGTFEELTTGKGVGKFKEMAEMQQL